ncbi:site-specific integrase [Neptuniibacter sp.]|uniref:tyrosine-type recombinase/integrase n=1 Tax=Neptuniibacter sp. TaxID=1962643 RepID=UPI0026037706|nr:site-specific integrase [Neptuniibacter sp.]MCP4595414.1 site-specific integrase [Neptuniibacter sp.]
MSNQHKLTKAFLDNVEKPLTGQREIRDTQVPNLRALILQTKIVLIVRKCYQNQRHYSRIADYPFPIDKARQLAIQFCNDVETGGFCSESKMTVEEFYYQYYLPYLRKHKKNTGSEESKFNKWALPYIGQIQLRELKRIHVERLLYLMAEDCANSTVNRMKSGISKLLSLAVEHEILVKNIAAKIPNLDEDNKRYRILTPTELPLFVESCFADEDSVRTDAILLCLFLGLRAMESYSLTISQVAPDLSSILLRKTKSKRDHRVYLNTPAKEIIRRRLSETWNEFLFPSEVNDGRHIGHPYVTFQRICKRAGISVRQFKGTGEPLIIHDLRRTWSHYCLSQSDMETTSKMMNHSSIQHTADRYAHYNDQYQTDVSERVGLTMLDSKVAS